MATIGLEPVGSATLSENFDWMVLDQAARQALGAITDPDARELVRDYYLDQRFRCDVFARGNRQLGLDERAGRLHLEHLRAGPTGAGNPLYDDHSCGLVDL